MNIKNTTWNTYRTLGYTYDVANDQASAGGAHLHQVRKANGGWQKRIKQSNGNHIAYGPVSPMTDAEGSAAFEAAKNNKPVKPDNRSKCDECGKRVSKIIGCPDGYEICQECFDSGLH